MDAPGFLSAYDAERTRRDAEQRAREEIERYSQAIDDHVTRDIALLLRQQEAHTDAMANQIRLRALLSDVPALPAEMSDRVQAAYVRAATVSSPSSIEALEREIARQYEEEEHAVMMLLLH